MQKLHGAEQTAHIAAAQQAAIERIAGIVREHGIQCDFARVPGYMFQGLPPTDDKYEVDTLRQLYDAAKGTKALDVQVVDDAGISGWKSGHAIRFGNQATFHPTQYVRGLARVVVEELGGKVYEKTRYMSHEEADGGVKAELADGQTINAGALVMATNVPLQKVNLAA